MKKCFYGGLCPSQQCCQLWGMLRTMLPFLVLVWPQEVYAQKGNDRITRQEYIDMYAPAAVQEMLISKVPASITLAQGLLESGDGNSELAKEARNHFGIKCHGMWEGEKHYHDDDKKGECFRVYATVFDSYRDHSEFLSTRDRYSDLFKLKLTDYKGWAHGLKKAGYATNPKYPELLIRIIEENDLTRFDRMDKPPKGGGRPSKGQNTESSEGRPHIERTDEAVVSVLTRQMYLRNDIRYVRIEDGDTYEGLERLLDVRTWQLVKYNDLPEDRQLTPGDLLYIQPKRNRNRKHDFHYVTQGETLRWISQEYGIKLKKLKDYNGFTGGVELQAGQKIWLRKKKRKER